MTLTTLYYSKPTTVATLWKHSDKRSVSVSCPFNYVLTRPQGVT